MPQWEYKVIDKDAAVSESAIDLSTEQLNYQGNAGWELVAAIPLVHIWGYSGDVRGSTDRIRYIFKRRYYEEKKGMEVLLPHLIKALEGYLYDEKKKDMEVLLPHLIKALEGYLDEMNG